MRATVTLIAALLLAWPLPAAAQQEPALTGAEYGLLAARLNMRAGFETLPRRSEPGINLDAPLRHPGLWLGERLAGQRVAGPLPHDRLAGQPTVPLQVLAGAAGQNMAVAYHRGFGSNALFPLGRSGFPAIEARGEGAVAIVFDQGQQAIGLKVHSGYARPLGRGAEAAAPGQVIMTAYARNGQVIGRYRRRLDTGINLLAIIRSRPRADIAAITLENTDPGGIAIDDIIYDLRALAG